MKKNLNNKNVFVTVDDIVNGGKWDDTQYLTDKQQYDLIVAIGRSGVLKDILNSDQIQNLAQYFVTLRFEHSALLWWVMGSGHQMNSVSFHQCRIKGSLFNPSIHMYYMNKNDSKDKNDTWIRRALRDIDAKFASGDTTFKNLV